MNRKGLSAIFALVALVAGSAPLRAYTLQYRDNSGLIARHWLTRPIIIGFSSSLLSPPANIKRDSDLIGAARRALAHWSHVADVQFFETASSAQTISPANAGDRINLITVSAENANAFGLSENPARTRLFYDSGDAIVEADIALNPNVDFSSDGTPGTYDLESTLTHEVGHLLGLEHSAVIGATMQPRQAINGIYDLPAFTQRTLSEDDIAGARALYGSRRGSGSISGKLIANALPGQSQPVFGGHVFAEDIATGRVVAGSVTLSSGEYRIDALMPGSYRLIGQALDGLVAADEIARNGSYANLVETTPPFRSLNEFGSNSAAGISVAAGAPTNLSAVIFSNLAPVIKPRLIGMNGELSTTVLPLRAGKKFRIYVGGDGLDTLAANGISISSPFFTVDQTSVMAEDFDTTFPVISFEVTVARDVMPGEYSIRLQSDEGEFAYLPGAITIDPDVDLTAFASQYHD
jgi:hypothetical protein